MAHAWMSVPSTVECSAEICGLDCSSTRANWRASRDSALEGDAFSRIPMRACHLLTAFLALPSGRETMRPIGHKTGRRIPRKAIARRTTLKTRHVREEHMHVKKIYDGAGSRYSRPIMTIDCLTSLWVHCILTTLNSRKRSKISPKLSKKTRAGVDILPYNKHKQFNSRLP